MEKRARIAEIDIARGAAIVLMMIYHFIFDLNFFGILAIDLRNTALVVFQRIIGVSFLAIAGISISISESRNSGGYMHHLKRGAMLGAVALLITVATWVYPHAGFIQFGIIHLIALSVIIAPFFFRFGKWNVLIGLVLVALGLVTSAMYVNSPYLFWLGLVTPDYQALDHYPVLPWFGVILIGIYLGQQIVQKQVFKKQEISNYWLEKAGKNSLAIYLAHQLVLVGMILLYLNLAVH